MMKRVKFTILAICMVLGLSGCAKLKFQGHEFKGSIFGNTYTIDQFDNYGGLQIQTTGERIDIEGNVVESDSIDSDGMVTTNYELSSVITITIDGHEMESCGDTLIFYEEGLEPDVAFEPVSAITSTSDGGITDAAGIAGKINEVKNKFGKSRVIVVKSQLGTPIYAFSGNEVYWDIPDDLPKFTKLMIDGKALYIHRSNFTIIDKALLK